jgi:hypothetical protein
MRAIPVPYLMTIRSLRYIHEILAPLTFSVSQSNAAYDAVRQKTGGRLVRSQLNVTLSFQHQRKHGSNITDAYLGPKGRISCDSDPKNICQLDQRLLGQVRVKLDLQNLGMVSCVALYIKEKCSHEIAIWVLDWWDRSLP